MAYDDDNIFAKILRGEIPCNKVYEDDHVLAFHDIAPQAPVHVLVIPKGRYLSSHDFFAQGTAEEIVAFTRAVSKIAEDLGVQESGYRLISNHGRDSRQEVPHYHLHLCAGRDLGKLFGEA